MTLQEHCLSAIGRSLEMLCNAYYSTDNVYLREGFHFLQKAYASELVSLSVSNINLCSEYADLVFSKYLRSMDTGWFLGCPSWKIIMDTFARIGPNLENVFFNEDCFSLETLQFNRGPNRMRWRDIICYLPNVKSITYQRFCDSGVLKCIAKYCSKLESLDIKHSYIIDDGLKYFYQKEQGKLPCPLLKEMFLQPTSFGCIGIKELLINLPLLETLDHSDVPFSLYTMHKNDIFIHNEVFRYNLQHLNLLSYADFAHSDLFSDILKVCIAVCPKLKSFRCPLKKLEHSNICSALPEVEDLYLNCVTHTSVEVNDVLKKKGGKLTSLSLRNCSVSLSVLAQCCPLLSQLTVNIVNIQCNESDSFSMFYNLKTFIVQNVDLSNPDYCTAICHILASSPALENLCLKECKSFSLEIKTEILKCSEQYALKHINFGGSSVDAQFIKVLLTCSTLESLTVEVSGMDYVTEEDLSRTSRDLPNSPELIFVNELTGNFRRMSNDIIEIFSDNEELNEAFKSNDILDMLIDTDEISEIFSDEDEMSNDTGELSEYFSDNGELSNDTGELSED